MLKLMRDIIHIFSHKWYNTTEALEEVGECKLNAENQTQPADVSLHSLMKPLLDHTLGAPVLQNSVHLDLGLHSAPTSMVGSFAPQPGSNACST